MKHKEITEEYWLPHQVILRGLYKFFKNFGVEVEFFSNYGKYEYSKTRIEKQYLRTDLTPMFTTVVDWLKKEFEVPV